MRSIPYQHAVQSDAFASDALYRALVPVAESRATRGHRQGATPTWDNMLALSHAQRSAFKRRRRSDVVSTQERIAREFLVARRLASDGHRNWAQSWLREAHPERCVDQHAEKSFLRHVRRWAKNLAGVPSGPDGGQGFEPSTATVSTMPGRVARTGCALDVGTCVPAVPPSQRRRREGAGGPGRMLCPEIGEELFSWFVDSIRNIKGRMPSFLLLHVAQGYAKALSQGHEQDKEDGMVPASSHLRLPKLCYSWLRRWRRLHHVA